MQSSNQNWKQITIGCLTLLGLLTILAALIYFVTPLFFNIPKETLAALSVVVAASITAFLGYRSSLKSKQADKEKEIEQELRKQKAPIYEDFSDFLFKILKATKSNTEVSEVEMLEFIVKFNQKLIVWGGDNVIKAWTDFRFQSTQGNGYSVLFSVEDILFAIRLDMGHSNKNLKRGDLLRIFINDYDEAIQKLSEENANQLKS